MSAVDVVVEDARWHALDIEDLAEKAVLGTFRHLGLETDDWEVVLLACNDERISTLNSSFRGKDTATNVLSWPSEERGADRPGGTPVAPEPGPDMALGDIAIAYETCAREANAAGLSLHDHATHLVVHAVLHLLGYDHEDERDAALMEGMEIDILASIGVANPY